MDRILQSLLPGDWALHHEPRPRGWDCGSWWLMVELSLKLLSPLLLVPVSQASLPLNPQSAPNDPLPWGDS